MENKEKLHMLIQHLQDEEGRVIFLHDYIVHTNEAIKENRTISEQRKIKNDLQVAISGTLDTDYNSQITSYGSFRSGVVYHAIADFVEGDFFDGEPVKKVLKKTVTVSKLNNQFKYYHEHMRELFLDLLMNHPHELKTVNKKYKELFYDPKGDFRTSFEQGEAIRYAVEFEGYRKEKWKKTSAVVQHCYETDNTFFLAQILKEAYPFVFKRTFKDFKSYKEQRGKDLTPSKALNETLAYFYLYSLPSEFVKQQVHLQFYADLVREYAENTTFSRFPYYETYGYDIDDVVDFSNMLVINKLTDKMATIHNERHIENQGLDKTLMKYSHYLVPHKKNEELCDITEDKVITFYDLISSISEYITEHEKDTKISSLNHFIFNLVNMVDYGYYFHEPVLAYDLVALNEIIKRIKDYKEDEINGLDFLSAIHYYLSTLGMHIILRNTTYFDADSMTPLKVKFQNDEEGLFEIDENKTNKGLLYIFYLWLQSLNDDGLSIDYADLQKEQLEKEKQIDTLSKELEKQTQLYKSEKRKFREYKRDISKERKQLQQFKKEKHNIVKTSEELKELVSKQEEEKKELLKEIKRLQEKVNKSFEDNSQQQKDIETIKKELIAYLQDNRIVIIGGHIKWQNKLLQELSEVAHNINMIDIDKRVMLDFLDTTENVFIVSKYNNHGYSYQVDRNKKPHNKIHYLDTTNIEYTLKEMHQAIIEILSTFRQKTPTSKM